MKRFTILSLVLFVFMSISVYAQPGGMPPGGMPPGGRSNGLLNPTEIKPHDTSTTTILKGMSNERHDFREIPADSEMQLIKDVVYRETKTIDGDPLSLKMDVITYKDNEPRPCIVYVIGGGFSHAIKERNLYDRYEVAKAGYVIASIQYHVISTGIYSDAVKDIKAAIRYMRAHADEYGVDPDNIGIWGESAGGYLTAMVGTTNGVEKFEDGENLNQSSDVKAAVDVYGLSDLTKVGDDYDEATAQSHYTVSSPDGQFIHGKDSGLTSLDKPEVVAQANPITYVDKNDPPFLLFHGSKDTTVSPSQTLLLHNALREVGVSSTRYLLEGAGHATAEFSDPRIIEIIVDFMDSNLK